MSKNPRTVIIGLDGVPFDMLKDFAEIGVMPNIRKLIDSGIFKKMHSTIPEISSVAWSSIITGENAGQHGIFGFMDLFAGSYKMRFPNFNDPKKPPFWHQWPGKSVIMNVPSTYPVKELNGVHISGFVSIDLQKSVYPKSLIPTLNDFDYRIDVDFQKAHNSIELFLSDLDKTLNARIKTYEHLWKTDWQTFMLVFTGTDRLMHFLWSHYEDKSSKYYPAFVKHFEKIDQAIGQIANDLTDDDIMVLLSDHGFERLDTDININYLLREQGLLQFTKDSEISLGNICPDTKAFALDPSRIYLNLKDKFPCGSVEQNQAEQVLSEIEDLFYSLEVDGKKAIKKIYRKEQIFSGPCLDIAPDLVLLSNNYLNLRANIKAQQLTDDKSPFTGKHTQDTAFLLIKSIKDKDLVPEIPTVSDVKHIIEKNNAISA